MKKLSKSAFLIIVLLSVACSEQKVFDGRVLDDVMNAQKDAWNQGDITTYMKGYWNSDSLIFTGGKSVTYGYKQALERYERSYSSKEEMGRLEFEDIDHRFLGGGHAFTIGRWILYRDADTLSGRYTLVWKMVEGEWRIIADHSS